MSHSTLSLSPRIRLFDGLTLAAICGGVVWLSLRALNDFNYEWDWARAWTFISTPNDAYNGLSYFAFSIVNTLKIAMWVTLFSGMIGLFSGLARTSRFHTLRILSTTYVGIIRNIPPLVSVFIFYFFIVAQLTPLLPLDTIRSWLSEGSLRQSILAEPTLFENMFSGIIALSIIEGAFITEIVRGGVQAIPKGQSEAGKSLGLSSTQTLIHIILPQLLKIIRLPLGNSTVSILKNTAILSLISVQDLTFAAQEMANSSGLVFEIWIFTAAIYLGLCISLDQSLQRLLR